MHRNRAEKKINKKKKHEIRSKITGYDNERHKGHADKQVQYN